MIDSANWKGKHLPPLGCDFGARRARVCQRITSPPIRLHICYLNSIRVFSHAINISLPRFLQRVIYGNVLTNPVDLSAFACVYRIFAHCTLYVLTEYLWGDTEGCLSVFIAFHAAICPEAASHICCTAFFPMFSLKRLQKTEMNPSVGRLRKRSVGPKRQERSRRRERRLCDVTGKVIKGQSVGRGSGRKGGGEQERLQWISWIICICYLITWKAPKVTDYHRKTFPITRWPWCIIHVIIFTKQRK